MGGGGKGGGDEAAQARRDENKRQQRIKAGTAKINSIFDGSTAGDGLLASGATYDPTATYYNADGTAWSATPAKGGGGGIFGGSAQPGAASTAGGAGFNERLYNAQRGWHSPYQDDPSASKSWGDQANPFGGPRRMGDGTSGVASTNADGTPMSPAQIAFNQAVASGKIYSGKKTTGGFNDDFYNQRKQSYLDYALPQISDQYTDANKQLTYALDRAGTLDSSIRSAKTGDLQKLYDRNMQQATDQALSYENQAKTGVEDARSNLITTLNATGDAEGAANAAIARSQTLAQAPTYSPLSNLFADFTSLLGTQAAQDRANALSGGYGSTARPNTGLYGNSKSVVTT